MSAPTSQELSLAMSMIDRRLWRLPAQVIDMLRFATVDAPDLPKDAARQLSDRQAAEWLYGDPKYRRNARRVLDKLVDDRVLESIPGAGSRATGYRINGAFAEWQNVEWRPTRGQALARLSAYGALLSAAPNSGSAAVHRAALTMLVPLSGPLHKPDVAQPYGGRHKPNPLAAIHRAAQSRPDSLGGVDSSLVDSSAPSLTPDDERTAARICGLLGGRVGKPIYGRPQKQIKALVVEGLRADDVLRWIDDMPADCQPLSGAQWIAQRWHTRDVPESEVVDLRSEPPSLIESLSRQIARLDELIDASVEDWAADEFRHERRLLQDQLDEVRYAKQEA